MKTIFTLVSLFLLAPTFSQEICDDFITYDEWEYAIYTEIDYVHGDTLGYFADGALTITADKNYDAEPTGELAFDGFQPGIFGYNMGVQFNFLGNEQTVTMQVYVPGGVTYDQFGFYINESEAILLDTEFPIVAGDIAIDMENLGILGESYELLELTFTGDIDSIQYQPSTSGIIEICSTLPDGSGINKQALINDTKIYPNPTKNVLSIESNTNLSNVLIYDCLGEMVFQNSTQNALDIMQLDLSLLPPGLYVIEMASEDGTTSRKKFIKN